MDTALYVYLLLLLPKLRRKPLPYISSELRGFDFLSLFLFPSFLLLDLDQFEGVGREWAIQVVVTKACWSTVKRMGINDETYGFSPD